MAKRPTKTETESVNTFRDMEGEVITDRPTIAQVYRGLMEDSDAAEDLTDNQIFMIVSSVPGDDSDEDTQAARVAALELSATSKAGAKEAQKTVAPIPTKTDGQGKEVAPLAATPPVRETALKYSRLLDKDFADMMEQAADAYETVTGIPLRICENLERKFGDLLKEWPIPGTGTKRWMEKPENQGYNGPVDIVYLNDDGKPRRVSFYEDLWDGSTEGKHINAMITALKEMQAAKSTALPSTPEEFQKYSGDAKRVDAILKRWQARRTRPLNRLKVGVAFAQAKHKLAEFPLIGMELVDPAMEDSARIVAPILLYSTDKKTAISDPLTLGQFKNLKFDELAKLDPKEQTMPRLLSLSRRQGGQGQGAQASTATGIEINIKNTKVLEAALSALCTYFEDEGNNASVSRILNGNSPEKFQLMTNIFDLEPVFRKFCSQYKPQYDAYIDSQRKHGNDEAKAQLASGNGKSKAA